MDFKQRFFNAGDKIHEMMKFSISESAAGKGGFSADDKQGVGYWPLFAPAEEWFQVPIEMESGNETVRVDFAKDIMRRFGERGVVMLDPRHKPETEDPDKPLFQYALAPTEELVVARAQKLWDEYLLRIIEQHVQDCDAALAMGGRPRKATGFTRRAFKLKQMTDPGGQYFDSLKGIPGNGGVSSDVQAILSQMQAQQNAQLAIMLAIANGEKVDPELLKVLVQPASAAVQAAGRPITSGIATGAIKKPLGEDSWVKGEGNLDKGTLKTTTAVQGRKARTEQAEKAL